MDLKEFKHRLLIDPHDKSADMKTARLRGGEEYRRAAAQAEAFEESLKRAVSVPAPSGLAADIVSRRDRTPERLRRYMPWAAAASVVLAVVLGVVMLRAPAPPGSLDDYLAWHWSADGAKALTMLEERVPEAQLAGVLAEFNLDLGPNLYSRVRFVKLCPAPDGRGAHLVLATESGPVTLFYLPGVYGTDGQEMPVNGMRAWLGELETGTVAVIASPGQPIEQFASLVREEFGITQL